MYLTATNPISRYDELIMPIDHSNQPIYEIKAGLFKSLAHPIRIHVLELLCDGGEHSVTEIQQHTGLEASHLSAHLAVLRKNAVVASERRASHVFYRVASPQIPELLSIARQFLRDVVLAAQEDLSGVASLPDLPTYETPRNDVNNS